MFRLIFYFCTLVFTISVSKAQHGEGIEKTQLPEHINSYAEELAPFMHPNGKDLYFSRIFHKENLGGEFGGSDIWVTSKDSLGNFGLPKRLDKKINNNSNNYVIGFSSDGQRMYLNNTYKKKNKYSIAVSYNIFDQWSTPDILPIILPEHNGPVGFFMHSNEKILVVSMNTSDSFGKEDLYLLLKDSTGSWSQPINLGATINTSGYEFSPYLSEDCKTLYFCSDGHKGYGSSDIFYSEKKYNDVWTVWERVKNLAFVNSEQFEAYIHIFDASIFLSSKSNTMMLDIYKYQVVNSLTEKSSVRIEKLLKEAKELLNKQE